MKEILKKTLSLLIVVILSPFILLAVVCLILWLPFDYIKYKTSLYYKREKEKYSLFAGTNSNFKVYNEIAKHNLPIRYIKNPKDTSISSGWFVFDRNLIIIGVFSFEYDSENEKWICDRLEDEGDPIITLDEYVEIELQEYNETIGTPVCDKAAVLMSEDDVYDLDVAVNEKKFLLYKKDRVGKLKEFCQRQLIQEQIIEMP